MKHLKRSFNIRAAIDEVYNALTNPIAIELWTGYPAVMEPKAGTEFSLWEGDISGKNIEFNPGKKIVQEWFFDDPENASIVTIELEEEKKGTKIQLTHTNIPDDAFGNIEYGWKEYFWGALKKYLEG